MTTTKTKTRHHNRGLTKRCEHPRRRWTQCDCPWYLEFYLGKKYRFSLDVLAKARGDKPPRTRHQAEALADRVRSEIRTGTFIDPKHPATLSRDAAAALTVNDVLDQYTARHIHAPGRRPSGRDAMRWHVAEVRRTLIPGAHGQAVAFGEKPLASITKADIEALRQARTQARPGTRGIGTNRLLSRLRHVFSWAIAEGFIETTPFTKAGRAVIKLTPETPRDRRLLEGEEDRLLAHAGPHLRDVIIAALSTGCRLGELLSLQWKDIRTATGPQGQTRSTIVIRAVKSKTFTLREIPVASRLAAVLALRQHGPDGQRLGPDCFVFGTVVGAQVKSVKKSWSVCVLKAHGHTPQWVTGTRNQLAPASREAYRQIGLHLHDLRREFATRVLEAGSSLLEVRDLLGHSDISQTSTYLQSTVRSLSLAIEKLEQHQQQLAEARARGAVAPPEASDATTTAPPDRVQ